MFSTFTATTDLNTLDESSYLFDTSHDDLLCLSMPTENIHLKNGIISMAGFDSLGYGRESTASSTRNGDIQDSEQSTCHLKDELEGTTPDPSFDVLGLKQIHSPLQLPVTPLSAINTSINNFQNVVDMSQSGDPVNGFPNPRELAGNKPNHKTTNRRDPDPYVARTSQSLRDDSQGLSIPKVSQSRGNAATHRRTNSNIDQAKSKEFKASSSIPAHLSWYDFGQQCILAAESSRLHPCSLHVAEYKLLRSHINRSQVTIYLNIRNAILRLWHRNPLVYVSFEEAAGCARDRRYFGLARIAYLWLMRNGYINFGCVQVPNTMPLSSGTKAKAQNKRNILIIGAGMSGLGCARHLKGLFAQLGNELSEKGESTPDITVLEARPRVGGRIYSHSFLNQSNSTLPPGHRCTAEMGAHIIIGFDNGNPLNAIIRGQLGIAYHGLRDNTILYDYDGTVVEKSQDMLVQDLYNHFLEHAAVYRHKSNCQKMPEGDRDQIMFGRDTTDDGGPTIADIEQAEKSRSSGTEKIVPSQEEKAVIGVEKLAGRSYQSNSEFDPNLPIAAAIQKIGWKLKTGASLSQRLNLDTIAKASDHPTLGQVVDESFRQYQSSIDFKARDVRLLSWHHANLEYANAANVNQLSLSGWDQDNGNDFSGEHTQIIGGYQQVPRALWQCPDQLDVRFDCPIKTINYKTEGQGIGKAVQVQCRDGKWFEADHIVITTPLGVLKSGSIVFQPPLPDWKQNVIERMGFGLLNKVVLVYEKAFWESDRDMFGLLHKAEHEGSVQPEEYSAKRGRFWLFWNCIKTSGKPVLIALMAGEAAHYAEASSDDLLVKEVTDRLDSMFAPQLVPLPSETIVTRWKRDPFARGSYSYVAPETQAGDYDVMARPHGPLHFAGEATCGTHPATVHGAYLSGLRAAAEVFERIAGPIKIESPLIEKRAPKIEQRLSFESKRKLDSTGAFVEDDRSVRLQRDEAYEACVMGAIVEQIGERPIKPGRQGVNPFLLYTKDHWYTCKEACDNARKVATGNAEAKASKQEIRNAVGLKWRTASQETKQPYLEQASHARDDASTNAADFRERVITWDLEAARIRREYVEQHPRQNGKEDVGQTATKLGTPKRVRRL